MAKDDTNLVIKINGDIKGYTSALEEATAETKNLQATFNKIAKTGAVAFAGFTGAIALATIEFAEFDNGLRGVKTLLDETSFSTKSLDEGFQDLSGDALKALSEFPVTLEAVNKSLFDIVSAGVDAEKSISVLGSTSRLAVAGITSAAVATDGVTSALNAYGLEAEQAESVAAKFFTAQKFGKTTIQELSRFLGEGVSTAKEFGVSLDELFASLAAATTGGIKTSQAVTALVAAISNVSKPTAEAREEAERLGIEFNSTALRSKGLKGFLDDLTNSQNFNKQSIEKLFGSTEAQKIIFSLTGEQADKFKETLDALSDSQQVLTTFSRAYEEQSESLKNQVIILRNNFQALQVLIGKNLAPQVVSITSAFTKFLNFLQANPALADLISKTLIAGTVIAGLTTTVGLAGLAFIKLRAIVLASAAATKGMTFAVKNLVGSTALGLFLVFLPQISDLLENSLAPALVAVSLGLGKTAIAMKTATLATNGLRIAVKGLIGSTGLGLLIAFLPEIIQLIKEFFGDSTVAAKLASDEQRKIAEEQTKNELEINRARTEGLSEIEIDFIKRQQELKKRAAEINKIEDQDVKKIELRRLRAHQDDLTREREEFRTKQQLARNKAQQDELAQDKKVLDTKLQGIKDENERIKAALDGQEQEQIGFLKRRQELRAKALEAEKEQDEARRNAALENIRLLNLQLLQEEKGAAAKRKEIDAEKIANETARTQAEQEAQAQRINALKTENDAIKAALDGRTREEAEFLKRRQTLLQEQTNAANISNEQERNLALENIRLKHEQLLEEEASFFERLSEQKAEQTEIENALQAELNALSTEQRRMLQEEEINDLRNTLQTKEKIRSLAVKKELEDKRKENALREAEEQRFGKTIAGIKAFFRKQEFEGAAGAAAQLAQLQQSENATQKTIGKAAALVQIGINTQKGAIAAYSALAGIPIVGPALGTAAAAALIAFGAERAARVAAYQDGGIVAGTGSGDIVPAMLEPRELIVPRQNFEEVVNSVADQRATKREVEEGEAEEATIQEILVGFDGEEAADVLTIRQNEQSFFGISQRIAAF